MAVSQHTETRPKFTWLFLGKPQREDFTGKPITLRTEADTEQEAREAFPAWELTFAAKIRTDCPVTYSWCSGTDKCISWMITGTEHDPEALVRHFASFNGVNHD
ncbi:host cell division inhibitor Icd-like protein [Citrobacter braakii]|uniref:host cell division inhibitor Icd-like protein n=1 Tax=Citrobacter braakii TaxID=57706 RepID=UPI0040398081